MDANGSLFFMACSLLELDPPSANLSFVVGILSSVFYLISSRGGGRQGAHVRVLRPGEQAALICSDLLSSTSPNFALQMAKFSLPYGYMGSWAAVGLWHVGLCSCLLSQWVRADVIIPLLMALFSLLHTDSPFPLER